MNDNTIQDYIKNNKIDIKLPIILVDTSYWLYYRFFALRKWYIRAYPETQTNKNFNIEHNWLEDKIFITKYKKLFIENIKNICRIFKTVLSNVIFCIDCPYKEIWRCQHTEEYKGTRLESHKKQQFNSFNIFEYIKKNILPLLQTNYNIKILSSSRCEADDIIGNIAPWLVNKGLENIYILANDYDYLQICNNKIHLINGIGKIISNEYELKNKYIGEKYLICKILIGDKSDNIKCCRINSNFIYDKNDNKNDNKNEYRNIYKGTLEMIVNNEIKYNILKNILYDIRNNINNTNNTNNTNNIIFDDKFKKNTILMDFQMLPNELKIDLENKFNELI